MTLYVDDVTLYVQVFTFVLMDITINNFVEMFLPGILSTLFGKKGDGEVCERETETETETKREIDIDRHR